MGRWINADTERVLVSTVVEDYTYVYTGDNLTQMTVTTTTTTGDTTETASETLTFAYDASGIPMSVTDNGTVYYYACNIQGDVAAILDANGTAVVRYTYDAWGSLLAADGSMASTLGETNPLRYRGYAYDTETGLYYLQSRCYNPKMGRFLNADGYVKTPTDSLLSTSMFAYCENNPVNKFDPTGDFALTATLGGIALWEIGEAIIGAVAALVVVDTLVKNPPTFPTISIPIIEAKPKSETKDKTEYIVSQKPRRDPVHHIVAKADPRAAESRKILRDVGIEPVTDPKNLVMLPQSYHVSLHTTAYHNYVTERLRQVAGNKAGIEATLVFLKAEILAYSALGIRWD